MRISIIIAYYNRKELFYNTLKTITNSKFKDYELIVVDDGSSPEHRIEDFIDEFPFMRIIRIERKDKWYINPCVPFNIGIRAAIGDVILLQNPECLHVHDVLSHVDENINDYNYISMSTYSLDKGCTDMLPDHISNNTLLEYFNTLPNLGFGVIPDCGWYNHSNFRPANYHFCSAITKINMDKLNGFDERYAKGIGYDDNDLVLRIKRLGLNMIIADHITVIHQYHPTFFYNTPNAGILYENNRILFQNVYESENKYRANLS